MMHTPKVDVKEQQLNVNEIEKKKHLGENVASSCSLFFYDPRNYLVFCLCVHTDVWINGSF